jgi:hypothetical protein
MLSVSMLNVSKLHSIYQQQQFECRTRIRQTHFNAALPPVSGGKADIADWPVRAIP